ncbi:MAG TPA: hypothetical protein VNN55_11505 [bacterium]|nr:hypothetical protein [bacterium]
MGLHCGSTWYTYKIHPENIHQAPAAANEASELTLPNPPSCLSAYVLYVNIYSPGFDPSMCSQNQGACE